jgi:hypothetical protein
MTITQFLTRAAGGITIIAAVFLMVASVLAAGAETIEYGRYPGSQGRTLNVVASPSWVGAR